MSNSLGGNVFFQTYEKLQSFLHEFYSILSGEWHGFATLLVTLYIAIIGYRLVMGKYGEGSKQMMGVIIAVPIVYSIAFSSDIYTDWFVDPVFDTMFGLMSLFISGDDGGGSIKLAFAKMDNIFTQIFTTISTARGNFDTFDFVGKGQLLIVQFILGLTYGALYVIFFVLLIMGLFALHVFFVIGSIPIFLAAFPDTRHIFYAWLKSIANYALIPVFTAIVMSITIFFLDSAVASIATLDVNKDGVFTKEIGFAIFIGIMSITFHLKAPEFAAALTGGQASGMSGFFGTVGSIGGAAALVSQKTGLSSAASGAANWGKGAAGNAVGKGLNKATGGYSTKAFSLMKGVGK